MFREPMRANITFKNDARATFAGIFPLCNAGKLVILARNMPGD